MARLFTCYILITYTRNLQVLLALKRLSAVLPYFLFWIVDGLH
jgi:hypothetical protein